MKLALVVPCYNEEEVLDDTTKQLCSLFYNLYEKIRYLKIAIYYM